ncbi:MAG: hypothetical protein V1921_08625 [Candidatus Altiarchaeota archaeon]
MKQSRLTEHGFEKPRDRIRRESTPMKSLCVSCGKDKMLLWVVDGRRVCSECKEYLTCRRKQS